MSVTDASPVVRTPAVEPDAATAFFAARMAYQTDVSDVHSALQSDQPGFVLVDTRGPAAWAQGHIPRAIHLPTDDIPQHAHRLLDPAVPVVTYCWGPGCNGSTRAALALSQLGYRAKEMIGGLEYWVREGFPVDTDGLLDRQPVDPMTAPSATFRCDC